MGNQVSKVFMIEFKDQVYFHHAIPRKRSPPQYNKLKIKEYS